MDLRSAHSNFRLSLIYSAKPIRWPPRWSSLHASAFTGLLVACAYWDARKINAAADRDDVAAVCRLVQGGTGGLAEQKAYLAKLKKVLI